MTRREMKETEDLRLDSGGDSVVLFDIFNVKSRKDKEKECFN